MEFSASQRQQVNSLHGTAGPSNYRDASSNSRGTWKNSPTLISAPSNARNTRPKPAGSPYDQIANGNSLRTNPNARRTVLGTPARSSLPQEHKRPKFDHTFSSNLVRRINNSNSTNNTRASIRHTVQQDPEVQIIDRPHGMKSTPAHHSHPFGREAEVISDGEDLGVPLPRHEGIEVVPRPHPSSSSPDPMNLHPFQTFPGDPQYTDSRKGKGRDSSPTTQSCNAVVSDEVDDIEDFSSEAGGNEPLLSSNLQSQRAAILTPIPPYIVRDTRKVFERPLPFLDLRKQNALSGGTGVVKKMKPRKTHKPVPTSQSQYDHITTSSTQFTSKELPRTKDPPLKLPLRAWAIGLRIFNAEDGSESPVFEYDAKNKRLTVAVPGQSQPFQFQQNGFENITVTTDDKNSLKDNVIIQLRLRKDCEISDNGKSIDGFQPGLSRGRGCLTFLFSTDEAKGWTQTIYQNLRFRLAEAASAHNTVRPTSAHALWEDHQRTAEMYQQRIHSSSNPRYKSMVPSIKNASPAPDVLSSTVNSGSCLAPDTKSTNAEASASLRRSSRRSAAAAPEIQSESPPIADPEELILVYPPSGPGALNIMGSDLNRLRPHEFLNDTLIEFGLKLWLTDLKEQNPELAEQIHVFSSFFYKKLNNKKSLDEGYQSVKKWTSRVNIFSKKYIIVPINENLHWYLAIIYEPEHTLLPPLPRKEPSLSQRGKLRRKTAAEPDVISTTEPEVAPPHDLPVLEARSEPDAEAASLHATCASTPSITQDEDMDDISPVEFSQSCAISTQLPPELLRPSSSNSVSTRDRSASVGKASGRSMSIEAHVDLSLPRSSPHPVPMDVDTTVIDIDKGIEPKENLPSSNASTSTHVSEPPSALSSKPPSRMTGIPVAHFYGTSAKNKGKQKATEPTVVPDSEEEDERKEDDEREVDAMLDIQPSLATQTSNDPLRTWIFTLDSLGSRHPQAQKVLRYWLKAEAKDKRQFDEVRLAEVKLAQVPSQPNFADCGVYLLHFAKTFVSDPVRYFDLIHQSKKIYPAEQRKLDWNEAVVQYSRKNLIARIQILSKEWKVSRAVKEEDAKRKRESEELGQADNDSDAEVDILEDVKVPQPTRKSKEIERPAKRWRG